MQENAVLLSDAYGEGSYHWRNHNVCGRDGCEDRFCAVESWELTDVVRSSMLSEVDPDMTGVTEEMDNLLDDHSMQP